MPSSPTETDYGAGTLAAVLLGLERGWRGAAEDGGRGGVGGGNVRRVVCGVALRYPLLLAFCLFRVAVLPSAFRLSRTT